MEIDQLAKASRIQFVPCPVCALCGNAGTLLYSELTDRLFSAQGAWNLKVCATKGCGLVWLDPMPLKEDLGKAYENYYTHNASNPQVRAGSIRGFFDRCEFDYFRQKHGYPVKLPGIVRRVIGGLAHFYRTEGGRSFLDWAPNGRVLDVGCGSGQWMLRMRQLGWEVEGVDFDEKAVKLAMQNDLTVRLGSLEDQAYPDHNFDAVVLSHVVEHVPDPVGTAAECARVLKPGGKLLIYTPNISSLSHKIFRRNWRGLEPPRHLHIFSQESIERLLRVAGFNVISVQPQVSRSVVYESLMLSRGQIGRFGERSTALRRIFARAFTLVELPLLRWNPRLSDCLAALATKT